VAVLAQLYVFADFQTVRSFLVEARDVRATLIDGFPQIVSVFGEQTPLHLTLERGPDDEDEDELFVLIHSSLDLDEGLAKLAALDDRWWRDAAARAPLLNIDLE
jgi:hypothetical protein